jgi:chemotaxis protein methyltransferase CheR
MDTQPGPDPVLEIMRLARQQAGIDLEPGQRAVVESRLGKRLRQLSCDMAGYLGLLAEDRTELVICIDLLTTNHTYWLREPAAFADFEGRILPAAAKRGRRMRVWCASATTGEEPYSIALCLLRTLGSLRGWDCSVLATDISNRALARASDGLFGDDRIAHLGSQDRKLALELAAKGPPHVWRVKPALKNLVQLARLNLIDATWPMHDPFDAIFCRNIMHYLDQSAQERLVNRFAGLLVAGGTLYLGAHEQITAACPSLQKLAPAIYLKA